MKNAIKLTALIVVLGIIFSFIYFFNKPKNNLTINTSPTPEVILNKEITASFEIYTKGTKRIFTDSKYHNLSFSVYIQKSDPSIVYVKGLETTWDMFFKTLPMKLTKDCLTTGTGQVFCSGEGGELKFFINDKETPNALEMTINQNDKPKVVYE